MELDSRKKIIEVATALFARKGFAGVSVREVTKEAQINVSAISYYFASKEGLYQAVLTEQLAPILNAVAFVREQKDISPVQRLTLYAGNIAQIHANSPFLSRFMNGELTNPTGYGGPIIEQHLSQAYQFITDALQEGIERGDFRADLNITYAAVSLAGILNFFFIAKPLLQKFLPLGAEANNEYTTHAFALYLRGIMPSAR
ncbi:TetR/AcrR family transcriptional regulator [Azotosporobacter soli]|uniref:TetR/AcrR family transcriptional regulator n=1 Tax=Azotosporobacter soli TaxID=3055040 RepID=UPI0031FF38B2